MGFWDFGSENYKECKENTQVNGKTPINVEIFRRDPNGDAYFLGVGVGGVFVPDYTSEVGGRGGCSALYTVKCTVGGDIWRGYVPHYIPEGGDMFCIIFDIYIYLKGDFSGQPIFHVIYLINLIGQK